MSEGDERAPGNGDGSFRPGLGLIKGLAVTMKHMLKPVEFNPVGRYAYSIAQ